MAYEVIIKKQFTNKLIDILEYLEKEWGKKVALAFMNKVRLRIYAIQTHPHIGSLTSLKNVRSTHITKHNRLYYKVVEDKIFILNLYDTRQKKQRL